jgi:menaquinone-dependent protoporphyrinogen oxidase
MACPATPRRWPRWPTHAERAASAQPDPDVVANARHDLAHLAVWLFSTGPFGAPEEHPTAPTRHVAAKLAEQLGAREHVMFGGRVPPDPSNFVERAMLENTPPEERDARD